MIFTRTDMVYGPFTDVACVVRRFGPFHFTRKYSAEKMYRMFTDKWCEPNIIDPAIRARAYNSMLVKEIYGEEIYHGKIKPIIKVNPTTLQIKDSKELHGFELNCGYRKVGLTIVCTNNDPDPMQFPPVADYVTKCMKAIGLNAHAITLMDEMKTILAEDKGGDDSNAP